MPRTSATPRTPALRAIGRAQWLGIVALALWFLRRPAPDPLSAAPRPPSLAQRLPHSRLDELSTLPRESRAQADTLGRIMRSDLSNSLGKVQRAERTVREAMGLRARDPGRSAALFREALRDNPYQLEALSAEGALALARGDTEAARGFESRCRAVDPAHAGCASLARALGDGAVTPLRGVFGQ